MNFPSSARTHTFASRRNRVWREGDNVYKQILPQPEEGDDPCRRAAFETDILARLHNCGVYVPKVHSRDNSLLTMEYIEGVTLADYIESCENGADQVLFENVTRQLVCWFESFYNAMPQGSVRGDVNCRNFLVTASGKIAGVDFEAAFSGVRETDLGKLIAFILTYQPPYTAHKKHLTDMLHNQFTARFDLDPVRVLYAQDQELKDMAARRNNKPLIEPENS